MDNVLYGTAEWQYGYVEPEVIHGLQENLPPVQIKPPEVMSRKTTMEARLTAVGKLCDEKQKEYGDAVSRSKEIMKTLYPDGVSVDQYGDVLLMVRVIDKLSRIATNAQAFGESPAKDIAGYAALWMREHGE